MKFPLSWLKEYLPTKCSEDEIARTLTLLGIEVEGMQNIDSECVMEISLTPNLAHCFGLIGIARELAASTGEKVALPKAALKAEGDKKVEALLKVSVEDPGSCPRYAARVIENVHVGPSPDWLKKRIELAGMRSVNNVVDITNYVMLEWGHPLHAFDYEKLQGHQIVVRRARKGESMRAIDGKEYFPTEEALLICDATKPVALAGIMGSLMSEVSEATKTVVLEAAYFAPTSVRRTSKQLSLATEASKRFERHTDPHILQAALDRASTLLEEIAGGTVARGTLDCKGQQIPIKRLTCRLARVNQILGSKLALGEVEMLLKRLGFSTQTDTETLTVTVPSYRGDVSEEIDLIEEIARLYGYDNLRPKEAISYQGALLPHSPIYLLEKKVRARLLSEGLQELLTCDLISPEQAEWIAPDCTPARTLVKLLNPSSVDLSVLRPSLLPNLLHVVRYNCDHGTGPLAGFEVGKIHFHSKETYLEPMALGVVLTGERAPHHWDKKGEAFDFYDLKGILENLLGGLHIRLASFTPSQYTNFHPGRQAALMLEQHEVGIFGQVHPKTCRLAGIDQPVFFAELNLDELAKAMPGEITMSPIPTLPPSVLVWTVTLPQEARAQLIFDLIGEERSELLEEVSLLDVYQSEALGSDKKNITFRFVYRDLEKTVSKEAVKAEHERILTKVMQRLKEESVR